MSGLDAAPACPPPAGLARARVAAYLRARRSRAASAPSGPRPVSAASAPRRAPQLPDPSAAPQLVALARTMSQQTDDAYLEISRRSSQLVAEAGDSADEDDAEQAELRRLVKQEQAAPDDDEEAVEDVLVSLINIAVDEEPSVADADAALPLPSGEPLTIHGGMSFCYSHAFSLPKKWNFFFFLSFVFIPTL